MRNLLAVAAALAFATIAMAVSRPPVHELVTAQVPRADGLHIGSKTKPVKVDGVLFIDQTTNDGTVGGCDGGPGICFTGKAVLVQDFPALPSPAGLLTVGNHICDESDWGQTATGVRFGDTCTLGIDQAYVNAAGFCNGYVSAADTVKVRCCGFLNDAGSFNMPDASYSVRCFR
jgi:hypothetical protein